MPASSAVGFMCFTELKRDEARSLLRESGAWFLRYSSDPCKDETEWWYVICDSHDPKKVSSNTRSKINRGNRNCLVRRLDTAWLAEHGYACYLSAYRRYKNATPVSKDRFRGQILRKIGGPFEHWGVFVGEDLAGYVQCIVEENDVATNVLKFHPDYLKRYTSYALLNYLVKHYVVNHGMILSNGNRSVAHDTNLQDFLLKLGFRKQFCRLNVIYPSWLRGGLQITFPFRHLVAKLPDRGLVDKLQTLLIQEEFRRLCQ